MKKIEIVLWDEFDIEVDMKLEMGHISVLTRQSPQDKTTCSKILNARKIPFCNGLNL